MLLLLSNDKDKPIAKSILSFAKTIYVQIAATLLYQ